MKLNKTFISACAISMCVAVSSCDSFLEEDPKGSVNDKYALTEEGAEAEIKSLYQINTSLLEELFMVGELGNDLFAYGGNVRDYWKGLIQYDETYMIDNTSNEGLWKWLYVGLSTANTAIESVDNAVYTTAGKKELLRSEAHALRAFYLFQIVETFGPASYYSETSIKNPGDIQAYQPGIATFYKRIVKDLDIADEALVKYSDMPSGSFGRMNLGVAKALRMRAMMSLANYDDGIIAEAGMTDKSRCYSVAADLANDLINNFGYRLQDDYASVFDPATIENNEIIWSIQYGNTTFDSQNNYIHRYLVSQANRSVNSYSKSIDGLQGHSVYYGREYRAVMPTYYFISVFDKYDRRRDATFISGYCRTKDMNLWPDFSDTILVRALDVLPDEVKAAYEARGIICDDIADVYDLTTGAVKNSSNVRSCANIVTKWLDNSRSTAKQEYAYKDAVLIRLGEVYITLAEANIRLGRYTEALDAIQRLRKRAIMDGHEDALRLTAQDMTIEFILDEGARELGAELFRWQMIKRCFSKEEFCSWIKKHNPDTSPSNAGAGIGIKPYHVNRPVPRSVINSYKAMNMEFNQNEGYIN